MAVTAAQLAVAVRADPADADVLAQMTRILSVADTAVRKFAPGAPENIRDEAIIRIVGYVYDLPTVPGPGFRVSDSALRGSGAAGWLAPYRAHRIGVSDASPDEQAGGGAGAMVDRAAVLAIVAAAIPDAVAAWALIGDATQIPAGKLANAPSGGMGGGLSAAQRTLLEELGELEAALTKDTALGESRNIIGASNDLQNTNIALPAARTEREIRFTVFDVGNAGAADGTFAFDLADLLAIAAQSGDPQATASIALRFVGDSGNVYWISRSVTHFAFSSDTLSTYRVVFTQHDLDATPFVTFPAAPAPGLSQTQVDARIAEWARFGNPTAIPLSKLSNAPSGGGGGSALAPAALPSAATSAKGTLANEGGELYELVSDDEQPNIVHFDAGARVAFRISTGVTLVRTGGSEIAWQTAAQVSPQNGLAGALGAWQARLSKTALGSSPEATLYVHVRADRAVADVVMVRDARSDTSTHYAYESRAGEPSIDAAAGATVEAHWYSDVAFSVARKVHSGNRWEKWVDLADLSHIADWALTVGGEAAERTGLATLMNAAATDAERIDYNALKNPPHIAELAHSIAAPALAGYAVTTDSSSMGGWNGLGGGVDRLVSPIAEGARGVILSQVDWNVAAANTASIAIGADTHDVDEVQLSDLLADDGTFAAGSAKGVMIGKVDVHAPGSGGRKEGELELYLARSAAAGGGIPAGSLGYYFRYVASVSTGGRGPFSIQARMRLVLLPSDAPAAAAAPSGGGSTATLIPGVLTRRTGSGGLVLYYFANPITLSDMTDPRDHFIVAFPSYNISVMVPINSTQSQAVGVMAAIASADRSYGVVVNTQYVAVYNGTGFIDRGVPGPVHKVTH